VGEGCSAGGQLFEVDVGPVHGSEAEVNGEAYAVETRMVQKPMEVRQPSA
jgi:hypothetical protein